MAVGSQNEGYFTYYAIRWLLHLHFLVFSMGIFWEEPFSPQFSHSLQVSDFLLRVQSLFEVILQLESMMNCARLQQLMIRQFMFLHSLKKWMAHHFSSFVPNYSSRKLLKFLSLGGELITWFVCFYGTSQNLCDHILMSDLFPFVLLRDTFMPAPSFSLSCGRKQRVTHLFDVLSTPLCYSKRHWVFLYVNLSQK